MSDPIVSAKVATRYRRAVVLGVVIVLFLCPIALGCTRLYSGLVLGVVIVLFRYGEGFAHSAPAPLSPITFRTRSRKAAPEPRRLGQGLPLVPPLSRRAPRGRA
jgi:hypothetical protein